MRETTRMLERGEMSLFLGMKKNMDPEKIWKTDVGWNSDSCPSIIVGRKKCSFVKPRSLTCCERKDFSWNYTKLLRPDEQQQSLTFPSHGIPFKQQIWFGSHNLVILLLSMLNLTFSFHSPIGPQNNTADLDGQIMWPTSLH